MKKRMIGYGISAALCCGMLLEPFAGNQNAVYAEEQRGGVFSWVVDAADEKHKLTDALVVAVNTKTGETWELLTDEQGSFSLSLPMGNYTIRVQAEEYEDYVWPEEIIIDDTEPYFLGTWVQMTAGSSSAEGTSESSSEAPAENGSFLAEGMDLTMVESPQYGYLNEHTDQWLNPVGVLSAWNGDLDLDGEEEVLVFRVRDERKETEYNGPQYPMMVEIYEKKGDSYALKAERTYGYDYIDFNRNPGREDISLGVAQWNARTEKANVIYRDGELPYIFCQHFSLATRFADGSTHSSWLLQYDGENIRDIGAFVQTAGGSSDFQYTGYSYENGELAKEELLYAEYQDEGKALYGSDYNQAIRSFYRAYGIGLTQSAENLWDGTAQLIDDTEQTPLVMEYTVRYTGGSGKPYEIVAYRGSEAERKESMDENEAWIRAYADVLNRYLQYNMGNFELAFVDGDDIPELVVTLSGAHVCSPEFYTYVNDAVVELGTFGSYGTAFYGPRTGCIGSGGMSHGYSGMTYSLLDNGIVSELDHYDDNEGAVLNESERYYHKNDVEISHDQYMAEIQDYTTRYGLIEIGIYTGFTLSAENIQAMMADPAAFVSQGGRGALPAGGLGGVSIGNNAGAASGTAASGSSDFASSYAMPGSDSRYLTAEEVNKLNAQAACYAKNEIYARHGRKFKSVELQEFFGAKSWYSGTISGDAFSDSVFNDFERKNIDMLATRERAVSGGGYALDQAGYDIYAVQ